MKKMIKASVTNNDITRTINLAILDVANDAFNNVSFDLEDPRNDYFVENITQDADVQRARKDLINALTAAINRAESY